MRRVRGSAAELGAEGERTERVPSEWGEEGSGGAHALLPEKHRLKIKGPDVGSGPNHVRVRVRVRVRGLGLSSSYL